MADRIHETDPSISSGNGARRETTDQRVNINGPDSTRANVDLLQICDSLPDSAAIVRSRAPGAVSIQVEPRERLHVI